jgi:hypothetical protein
MRKREEKTMTTATRSRAVLTTHDVTIQTAQVAMQRATKETLWT